MKKPMLSIIVPCYKVEKYLDRCLESLTKQLLMDIEIILVDDGSPDRIPQMCDDWVLRDGRIRVVHKENEGLGYARNSGLDIAKGEYVAFVDSDDYVEEQMYSILYDEAILTGADAIFCGFQTEIRKDAWKESKEVKHKMIWSGEEVKNFMLDMIASVPYQKKERQYQMSVWHAIYRRRLIESHHIRFVSEREVVSEDLPFHVDFLKCAEKIVYIPASYYCYCLNGDSLTASFKEDKYLKYKKLRELLYQKLGYEYEIKLRVERLFIGYTRDYLLKLECSNVKDKLQVIKKVVNDGVWNDIANNYHSRFLPIYPRVGYMLICKHKTVLLHVYCFLIAYFKHQFFR